MAARVGAEVVGAHQELVAQAQQRQKRGGAFAQVALVPPDRLELRVRPGKVLLERLLRGIDVAEVVGQLDRHPVARELIGHG